MHHVCKPKRMLTGLLAVALAALFVQAAAAHQVSQNDNTFAAVTVSNSSTTAKAPLVIPYVSHGVGVDTSLYSGTAQAPDAFERAVNRHEASGGYYDVVSGVFVPAHQAGSATSQSTAVRPDDREGVRGINASGIASRPQAAAVRPDDRSGLRGIGPFQATKSTASSSSSTNWNAILAISGILLGSVLILAVAVGLARRQHARVLAH